MNRRTAKPEDKHDTCTPYLNFHLGRDQGLTVCMLIGSSSIKRHDIASGWPRDESPRTRHILSTKHVDANIHLALQGSRGSCVHLDDLTSH